MPPVVHILHGVSVFGCVNKKYDIIHQGVDEIYFIPAFFAVAAVTRLTVMLYLQDVERCCARWRRHFLIFQLVVGDRPTILHW